MRAGIKNARTRKHSCYIAATGTCLAVEFRLLCKEQPLIKFKGWAGGILAMVIAGLLLYYFARPPVTTTPEGMVNNSDASAPVRGAMGSVEIPGVPGSPWHDSTDEHGSYQLDFTGLRKTSGAAVEVQDNNFQPVKSTSIAAVTLADHYVLFLRPLTQTPHPIPGAAIAHIPPPATLRYIPKLENKAVRILVPKRVSVNPIPAR